LSCHLGHLTAKGEEKSEYLFEDIRSQNWQCSKLAPQHSKHGAA